MVDRFVNSAAAGANDGTSKTDAWTSLLSAVGLAAGDRIFISHTHNQNPGSNGTYNFSNGTVINPVRLYSIDFADDSYTPATAAQFSGAASDVFWQGNIAAFGLYCDIADDIIIQPGTEGRQKWVDSVFSHADFWTFNVSRGSRVDFSGCTFIAPNGDVKIFNGTDANEWVVEFTRCVFQQTGSSALFSWSNSGGNQIGNRVIVDSSDLEDYSTIAADCAGEIIVRGCLVGSGASTMSGTPTLGTRILIESCANGTITVPPVGLAALTNFWGNINTDLTRYRTGGANDGWNANAHSFSMSSTNTLEGICALRTPWMPIRLVGGSAITVTAYVASGVTLQDDEFGIEIFSPSEAGSATARWNNYDSMLAPLGTPANLTTDGSSTWNGTGVGTKQKISRTFTPTIDGPCMWRAWLAKPGTTVYVDPLLEVS